MIESVTHFGLNVSDMDLALEFYRDTLGFDVDRQFPISDAQSDIVGVDSVEGEIVFLDTGQFEIELIAYSNPENTNVNKHISGHDVGVSHICLTVSDVNGCYNELSSTVEFIHEPQIVGNGAQIAYVRDPDGNYVEFYEPPADE